MSPPSKRSVGVTLSPPLSGQNYLAIEAKDSFPVYFPKRASIAVQYQDMTCSVSDCNLVPSSYAESWSSPHPYVV